MSRIRDIPIDRIFLNLENPRHEPFETQGQVIEHLCRHEAVYKLAWDIAKHGLNPMERFAVFPDNGTGVDSATDAYVVAEGNRRMCALKLLNDPDLAPTAQRREFEAIVAQHPPISSVPCIVFRDRDDPELSLWLDRIHGGEQGGIGRRSWNAEQKARHTGTDKNKVAQSILDYAQHHNLISPQDRKGKITTVQRYLTNPLIRDALGIDVSDPNEIHITKPHEDVEILLRRFMQDLLKGQAGPVNSRARKPAIEKYARELGTTEGQSGRRIDPEPLAMPGEDTKPRRRQRLQSPRKVKHVQYEPEIAKKLEALGAMKLQRLYHSICGVSLVDHTPLVAVGVWAFLESLSAHAGRKPDSAFDSFYSKERLKNWGLGDREHVRALRDALDRISRAGNITKHHKTSGAFDGEQLANDMETLKELIIKSADEALSKRT